MKVKKFLRKMFDQLDIDQRKSASRKARIKRVLKALKHRQGEIKRSLEDERDAERRKRLKSELAVIRAQRKKALKVLRTLSRD